MPCLLDKHTGAAVSARLQYLLMRMRKGNLKTVKTHHLKDCLYSIHDNNLRITNINYKLIKYQYGYEKCGIRMFLFTL